MSHATTAPQATDAHALPRKRRLWRTAPPLWQVVFACILTGLFVFGYSAPARLIGAYNIVGGLCVFVSALFVLGDYLVRLVVCLLTHASSPRDWRWYVAPTLLISVVYTHTTRWPLSFRFVRSRPALEAAAKELLAAPSNLPQDWWANEEIDPFWSPYVEHYGKRVGSYFVSDVAIFHDQNIVFFFTGDFIWSGWGFVYNPDGHDIIWAGKQLDATWHELLYFPPK